MSGKTVAATQFKADCLRLIEEMERDGQPVTVTRRGRPVAVLSPVGPVKQSPIGFMAGSVSHYDDPFSPATDPSDWSANS
ncbi:MAG: type II toxin-antitoxin system Phd/YefM family antitoxin [Caulobacterales bacterium]|nr:type II toxin-antitoxin system Phd/YefM family antitoxin [Caulobacterales bacterium]